MQNIFTADFQPLPYWWARTPRPDAYDSALPAAAEVVVVGSGYTGLHTAIQTARRGMHTVVVDAAAAGWGCSSRNGGQVSTSLKPTFHSLAQKFGADKALAILQEGNYALDWIANFITENNIRCDFNRCGRFYGAHNRRAYEKLQQKVNAVPSELNQHPEIIAPQDTHGEIGSDFYCGGALYQNYAALDPARYHQYLLKIATDSGVEIISHCKVDKIDSQTRPRQIKITTAKGIITAAHAVVATSGYTDNATPYLRRRIIPVGTYMIATEPLPAGVLKSILPTNRIVTDTRKLVVYYRGCPEQKRLLFGGRVALREIDARVSAKLLRREMLRIFPELHAVKISHSWMGFVGFTFDETPHVGVHNGVHYSMGYCGSGISLASYFGMKTGLKIAGEADGKTALDDLPFPRRWYYRGRPWFKAPAVFYYRWADRLGGRL